MSHIKSFVATLSSLGGPSCGTGLSHIAELSGAQWDAPAAETGAVWGPGLSLRIGLSLPRDIPVAVDLPYAMSGLGARPASVCSAVCSD